MVHGESKSVTTARGGSEEMFLNAQEYPAVHHPVNTYFWAGIDPFQTSA